MTAGDFPTPTRREPRGAFPAHDDRPRRLLTGPEALAIARRNLADWVAEHGAVPVYTHPKDVDDAE